MTIANLETITDMQSWCKTWPPNGSSHIRAKQKFHRKHREACKSSRSQIGSLKSFTLTERRIKVASREHKIETHFPEDQNCEVCKRTKMTRVPCRERTGDAVPRSEKFGDLITADHKDFMNFLRFSTFCVILPFEHDGIVIALSCFPLGFDVLRPPNGPQFFFFSPSYGWCRLTRRGARPFQRALRRLKSVDGLSSGSQVLACSGIRPQFSLRPRPHTSLAV